MPNTPIFPTFPRLFRAVERELVSRRLVLLSFAFPLGLRATPELLAGPWPLGFDTLLTYVPFVKEVQATGLWSALANIVESHVAPLTFILLGVLAVTSWAPPFVITKAMAPVLYGFLGLSIYLFARRGLGWDPAKSLILVTITTMYFVPLRLSWDLYKNTLGYAFFVLTFSYFGETFRKRDLIPLTLFASLCILASELTAVLLGSTAAILFLWDLARLKRFKLPLIVIATTGLASTLFYTQTIFPAPVKPSPLAPPPAQNSFPFNYVGLTQDVYAFASFPDIYVTVSLLTACVFHSGNMRLILCLRGN